MSIQHWPGCSTGLSRTTVKKWLKAPGGKAPKYVGESVDGKLPAAMRFVECAINLHDVPEKITIDKSGANTAAIESVKADACVDVLIRPNKYLNNTVEQDHRAIKRITRPMLGFKSFWSARILIAGIETMHMIKKGQMNCHDGSTVSAADQFYSLAV